MWQLKLVKKFLMVRAATSKSNSWEPVKEHVFLAQTLSSQVIRQFMDNSDGKLILWLSQGNTLTLRFSEMLT